MRHLLCTTCVLLLLVSPPTRADDVVRLSRIDALLTSGEAGQALAASEALLAAPDLEPRNRWRVQQRRAAALIDLGRPDEAVTELERALLDLDEASLHFYLGRALVAAGVRGRAVASYQQALARRPDDADWRLEYAGLLLDLGAAGDAEAEIREARHLCGDCPPALRLAASLALARGDHAGAVADLRALLDRGGGDDVRARLVAALWNAADTEGLAAVLDSVAVKALSGDELLVLAQLERQRGRADRVRTWTLDPSILPAGWQAPAAFWAFSAEACLAGDDAEAALLAIDRAIALRPAVAVYHHNRAAALVRLGHEDEARAALAEARRLDPDLGG